MNNTIMVLLFLVQLYAHLGFSQTKCELCFVGLSENLNTEYESLVIDNKSGQWLNEIELQNLKNLIDQYYKNNLLAYRIIAEQNWPASDDSFELFYFALYRYEFPAYSWAICVYKHRKFEIYNLVTVDVDGAFNSTSGTVINSRYFSEFHEELSQEFKINHDYQSGYDLNFSGFSVFFKNNKINKVRILHDLRYLSNLTRASDRVR